MPDIPVERDVGGTLLAVTTQNGSLVLPAVDSGDLLLVFLGKRASSSFTLPTSFTKQTELVTSGMVSVLGWKWGTLPDSGATIVCSTSGAGNLLHGMGIAIRNVESTATPLRGYITEARSSNIARAGSLTPVGNRGVGVCIHVGFDNQAPTIGGFTPSSWALVSSRTTTTGSDGQIAMFKRAFTYADSGQFVNPNSAAITAERFHVYTFELLGRGNVDVHAADDTALGASALIGDTIANFEQLFRYTDDGNSVDDANVDAVYFSRLGDDGNSVGDANDFTPVRGRLGEDSVATTDGATPLALWLRTVSDPVDAFDPSTSRDLRVFSSDVLELLDTVVVPSGTINTAVSGDFLTLSDGAVSVRLAVADVSDAVSLADEAQLARLRGLVTDDGLSLVDTALSYALRGYVTDDGTVVVDLAHPSLQLSRAVDDALSAADSAQWLALFSRVAEDALTSADEAVSVAARNILVTVDDTAALGDEVLRLAAFWRLAGDSVETVDPALASAFTSRSADDAASIYDGPLLFRSLVQYLGDQADVADAALSARDLTRVSEEVASLLDEVLTMVVGLQVRLVGDALEISDQSRTYRLLLSLLGDDLPPTDEVLRAAEMLRAADDSLGAVDQAWRETVALRGDSLDLADYRAYEMLKWLSDATDLGDSVLSAQAHAVLLTVEDYLETGDGRVWQLLRLVADAVDASDEALASKVQGAVAQFATDALAVSDDRLYELLKSLADALALGDDTLVQAARNLLRVLDDSTDATDDRLLELRKLLADAFDSADSSLGGALRWILQTQSDTVTVADLKDAVKVQGALAADLIASLLDAALVERSRNLQLDDQIPATDDTRLALLRLALSADALEIGDNAATLRLLTTSVFDVFDVTDDKIGMWVPAAARKMVWNIRVGTSPQPNLGYDTAVRISSEELPIQLGGFQ